MSEVTGTQIGTNPASDGFSIDLALTDWIYHRDGSDQGLSLSDIGSGLETFRPSRSLLAGTGLVMSDVDGFIYDIATGFTAAVVKTGNVYKVVFRGTDIGAGDVVDYVRAALTGGADRNKVDNLDIQQDVALGSGTRAVSQATDAIALTKIVQAIAPSQNSTVQLVGQSLGAGLAGVAAAVCGLPATLIAAAPFGAQLVAEGGQVGTRCHRPVTRFRNRPRNDGNAECVCISPRRYVSRQRCF